MLNKILAAGSPLPPDDRRPLKLLKNMGDFGGLGFADKSPAEIVGTIIAGLLSLLGVVFLVLMVYAGYLWMTAQGDPKKADKAKDIIKNSVIGLVLVLAAYGITRLVVSLLVKAT